MASIVAKTETQSEKPVRKNWEHERQRDRKMVTGKFLFHDIPGGTLTFNIQLYKGDPLETYSIKDGEVRTIPFGVAKHLNRLGKPVHEFAKDENGKSIQRITSYQKRCSFQSLDFLGDDGLEETNLYKVEKVSEIIK